MVDLNLNTLTVDNTGRVSFSGLSTGIDFQAAVDSIIAARRIPVDTLETKVSDNEAKIEALGEVRSALEAVKQALSRLYGAVTFGGTSDIFKAKSAFASASRIDGGTATPAASLLGVTVTNAAAAGSHTIEVLRTAAAHKVASQALASQTSALAEIEAGDSFVINAGLGYRSSVQPSADTQAGSDGTIEFTSIAGATSLGSIAYSSTDTLQDIADNITDNITGVSASVVSSGSGVRLEITATEAVDLAETGGGTLLTDLAITDRDLISVTGSESLVDLRDLINNAGTGVTASIASVSATQNFLVLTRDVTGPQMVIRDTTGDALESLGVLAAGGAFANELQAGATARFYADGLLDQTDLIYESALQSAATVQVGTTGTLEFRRNSDSGLIGTVNYDATDTLSDLAADITAIAGLTASVVADGAGVRLEITGSEAFGITETGAGNAIADLGINNKRLAIERETNTIDDLFSGVTLSLFQAEKGSTVKIDIEPDLSSVKSEISGFVETYNAFKAIANTHRQFNTSTGTKSQDAGVLFSSSALTQSNTTLANLVSEGVAGADQAFRVLAQIGIRFVDNTSLDDPLLANTLEIDEAALDSALLNSPDDVRKLFAFDFDTSDPRVTLLAFTGDTTYSASGYTLNIDPVGGTANINGDPSGADDGSASYVGGTVTVLTGGAKGLKVLTTGIAAQTSVQLDFTVGFAAGSYFGLGNLLNKTTGAVETEISNLTDQNELSNDRIEEMLVRLELQRQNLLERFIRMETALATANRILDGIRQTTEALLASNNR